MSRGMVRITIQAMRGEFTKELTCLIMPAIAERIPSEIISRDTIQIPSNIQLADPEFHITRAIDVLIGSGATLSLLSIGQINLSTEIIHPNRGYS